MDVDEQKQYKVQLLLHVNSLLLARALRLSQQQDQLQHQPQYLKRIHANLQCISQLNQGLPNAKPMIMDPPPQQESPQQDILAKLYLLMARVFEIW
ncbi:hypothetical protein J6895_01866 [Nakaseomyces glabratus]|nr:hypothetical protein J6895_01866 [Nakaseomyces glabratus]